MMRRFRFSLGTLQHLREGKLKQQEQKLATAVSEYNQQQNELNANRSSNAETWQNLRGAKGDLDPRKSHSDYIYLDRLERAGQKIDEKMHEAHLSMETEQRHYNTMEKDLHILEKLREKQYQKYKQDVHKQQDEALAEMSRAYRLVQARKTHD